MSGIRPLEDGDLEQVAALYELVARSGRWTTTPAMVEFFRRSFLEHPWADPEIPSLVSTNGDGRVDGFIGSHVRRFRFDGREIRVGCSGHLVTDPAARQRAVGAFLLRRYLAGPQELTITDTASRPVRRMWEMGGGRTGHVGSIGWVRLLRPWSFGREYLRQRRRGTARLVARPLASVLDSLSVRVGRSRLHARTPEGASEPLTADALVAHLDDVAAWARLHPAYDAAFAEWLLAEMALTTDHGELVSRLVRDGNGGVSGWFVYYRKPGGISQVMQVAGRPQQLGLVLDHLFHDAQRAGSAGVQGRLEPPLLEPLTDRHVLLHPSGYLALVHSESPELLGAIATGDALLTRMEGEWWMGHHLRDFGNGAAAR